MNITLIIIILLFLANFFGGLKRGMAKEISNFIALIVTFLSLALFVMLFSSFQAGEGVNTIYTIILLVILGAVYGAVRFLLKSARAICKLPVIHLIDTLLGAVTGILESIVTTWIFFTLCYFRVLGPLSRIVMMDIEDSVILTYLYHYNFFL